VNPFEMRRIGSTDVEVTVLGLGGTAYAGMYESVGDDEAVKTIRQAFDSGIRYFDTAPLYGHGSSEMRLGNALKAFDRESLVISSKVGRVMEPAPVAAIERDVFDDPMPYRPVFDFTRTGTERSFRESLERLQTTYLDICLVHDPDQSAAIILEDPQADVHVAQVMRDTWPALAELRDQGVVRAIGVGMNQWPMLRDFVETGKFDCILLAGRYTLLDQSSLDQLLPACERHNVSVIIGGPYNSGILATGAVPGAMYNYSPASDEILDRVRQLQSVCQEFQVEMRAAALQFPLAHRAVAAVIPGARSVGEVRENVRLMSLPIPPEFWTAVRDRNLIRPEAPVPQ
jgi:D-threo-aldose 1-dehydrogenase